MGATSSTEIDRTWRDEAAPRSSSRAMRARDRRRCTTCGASYPHSYAVCPRDATPLADDSESRDPLIGTVLANTYRLTRSIARGGMGRVYEAEHTRLSRCFAVKVLHESHADKPDAIQRLRREAAALARIRSDHVLDVADVLSTHDGRTAIVTGLLEGEDLQSRLDRCGTLEIAEAITIARQICLGLAAAHQREVIHRDIKPSNVFLAGPSDDRPCVKILDFGVAKLEGDDRMTRSGVVLGTPAYMAPEQARGSSAADERSDVYGVGAVLYRMLTGHMAYDGKDPGATLARVISENPKRPRALAPDLPLALESLIQRAMARNPDERPRSALELEAALAGFDRVAPHGTESAHSSEVRVASIERDARVARPLAVLLGASAAVSTGAVGASSLAAAASMIAESDAQATLGRALSIVGGIAVAIGCLLLWSRALTSRWSSAPAVAHLNRPIARALGGGLSILGAGTLAVLAIAAWTGATVQPSAAALLATFAVSGAVAWYSGRVSAVERYVDQRRS